MSMNAYTAGRVAGFRFAREWKHNLHLWTHEKLTRLAAAQAAEAYTQMPARKWYQQGFIEGVQAYRSRSPPLSGILGKTSKLFTKK